MSWSFHSEYFLFFQILRFSIAHQLNFTWNNHTCSYNSLTTWIDIDKVRVALIQSQEYSFTIIFLNNQSSLLAAAEEFRSLPKWYTGTNRNNSACNQYLLNASSHLRYHQGREEKMGQGPSKIAFHVSLALTSIDCFSSIFPVSGGCLPNRSVRKAVGRYDCNRRYRMLLLCGDEKAGTATQRSGTTGWLE